MEFTKSGQRDQMLNLVHMKKFSIEGSQLLKCFLKYFKTLTSKQDLRSRVEYTFYYYKKPVTQKLLLLLRL